MNFQGLDVEALQAQALRTSSKPLWYAKHLTLIHSAVETLRRLVGEVAVQTLASVGRLSGFLGLEVTLRFGGWGLLLLKGFKDSS